jgi:hypothetical protein
MGATPPRQYQIAPAPGATGGPGGPRDLENCTLYDEVLGICIFW